jgi:hypothetical protein
MKINANCKDKYNKTIYVFLRDGCKRSGVFVALSLVLEKIEIDEEVEIFQVVRTIQIRRPEFFGRLPMTKAHMAYGQVS